MPDEIQAASILLVYSLSACGVKLSATGAWWVTKAAAYKDRKRFLVASKIEQCVSEFDIFS